MLCQFLPPHGESTHELLDSNHCSGKLPAMSSRNIQLVLHYDGSDFAGWQRQPSQRTVQGEMESALRRLNNVPVPALGAGRTDAGVHSRGLAVGVMVAQRWTPQTLRRALNAILPDDIWVAESYEMSADFHPRFSAVARRYSYHVGLDAAVASPFRRRYEWPFRRPVDRTLLEASAAMLEGEHCFRAFAVRGTAPETDDHRCTVSEAHWATEDEGRLVFHVEANRFLHHMIRFLVGTMLDVASGRRDIESMAALLVAHDNSGVSPPAPPNALFLERVSYPAHFYLTGT